jgi:XapX domain-containing protein
MDMKILFLSFVVGLAVGVLCGLIRVKSPAPPIVALLGLLGMVLGEQLGVGFLQRK